jgi:hypothetical protein
MLVVSAYTKLELIYVITKIVCPYVKKRYVSQVAY